MFLLKSLWKPWSTDSMTKPPERDERVMVSESLMMEVEYHSRELEKLYRERDNDKRRQESGVDYSWLVSLPPKSYEIPQLERLELEELCYRVKPEECSKIIALFRDSLLNEPKVSETPRIMKACIQQVISQRRKEETFTEWVTKRTVGLTNMKLRPSPKVTPCSKDAEDIIDPRNVPVRVHKRSMSLPRYSLMFSQSSTSTEEFMV